jgi:hypothetical protein
MINELTRDFLMGLPDNVFILSSRFCPETGSPRYFGKVEQDREKQWAEIQDTKAGGFGCYVFGSKDDAVNWFDKIFTSIKEKLNE